MVRRGRGGADTGHGEKAGAVHGMDGASPPEYRIGAVTRELDLGQYTLKHYERQGLIEPSTSDAGFRFYSRGDFGKIIVIRSLRRLGFSVEEIAELLPRDPASVADALEEKYRANERAIAELQEANALLHRHVSSLRNNLARPEPGVYDEHTAGLVFVPHFKGDELRGGGSLVAPSAWRDLYEWSLIGLRVERDALAADGPQGCWWGLVPLGNRSEVERAAAGSSVEPDALIIDVPAGPALVVSATARVEGAFDILRDRTCAALAAFGCELAGDVFAIADATRFEDDGRSSMTLTLRIPVSAR